MRKSIVLILVTFLTGPASALTYMGPPCSSLAPSQASIGFEWAMGETDIEVDAFGSAVTFADVEADMMMGRFAVALGSQAELFARLGLGEIEDLGGELAWGAGLKIGPPAHDSLSVGVVAQVTNLRADETVFIDPYLIDGEINVYEIQVGPGLVWDTGPVSLYGGPMLQALAGDIEVEGVEVDIDQDVAVGGFGGVSVEISPTCLIAGEFQATEDGWAAGVNLQIRFGGTAPTTRQKETILPQFESGQVPAGYRGHIDPRTGEIQIVPVSPKAKLKVDEKGEPVKDKDGNFIFEPVHEDEQKK